MGSPSEAVAPLRYLCESCESEQEPERQAPKLVAVVSQPSRIPVRFDFSC